MKKVYSLVALALLFIVVSCKKDKSVEEPNTIKYQVPSVYSFPNVSYSGQTYRLKMLEEMETYMATGKTSGTVVNAQTLKNMFANSGAPFTDPTLNTSGKQLKDKCFITMQTYYEALMDSLNIASQSTVAGQNNQAGVVVSTTNAANKYLLSGRGFDYSQMIAKGLMGAVFYYQATATYLTNETADNVDNTTITPGEGTPMEHHWDEAFGYLGVPKNYPFDKSSLLFWGEYLDEIGPKIGSNTSLMNSFILGRAAISNKDLKTKSRQALFIKYEWERFIAACAISELNEAKANLSDPAVRNHVVSEAIGFVQALRYSPDKRITNAEIDTIVGYFGSNLYTISVTDINNAINSLSSIYGLNAYKATL